MSNVVVFKLNTNQHRFAKNKLSLQIINAYIINAKKANVEKVRKILKEKEKEKESVRIKRKIRNTSQHEEDTVFMHSIYTDFTDSAWVENNQFKQTLCQISTKTTDAEAAYYEEVGFEFIHKDKNEFNIVWTENKMHKAAAS